MLKPAMFSPLSFRVTIGLSLGAAFLAPIQAQEASVAIENEPTITLSPFVIDASKDKGYLAADTAVGGKLQTNLLKTPGDISVLTSAFLDDLVIFDINDAYEWLPNTEVLDNSNTTPDWGNNYSFRGHGAGTNTVNNIRTDTSIELYNTERLEQSRGPNAILFGDGRGGGTTNISTKRARFSDCTRVGFKGDTEGSHQLNLDANQYLTDNLAIRVNSQLSRRRNWLSNWYDDRDGLAWAATYRPWQNTEIRVNGSIDRRSVSRASNRVNDQFTYWDGTTTLTGPLSANPTGTGLSRFTTDKLVIINGVPDVQNFRNFAWTTGTGFQLDGTTELPFDLPGLERDDFTLAPSISSIEQDARQFQAAITQQIGDLALEFQAISGTVLRDQNHFDAYAIAVRIDPNEVLPDGSPNPNFGKRFIEGREHFRYVNKFLESYYFTSAYPLPIPEDLFSQVISVGAERRIGLFDVVYHDWGRANNPSQSNISNGNNAILHWRYWDEEGAPHRLLTDLNDPNYEFAKRVSRDTRTRTVLDTLQLNTVGRYFRDKLTVIDGLRFDDYESRGREARTGDTNNQRQIVKYSYPEYDRKVDTMSYGATYFSIPSVGVYANYSEGFQPIQGGNIWIGERGPVGTTIADFKSAGFRFQLFQGQLVGSLGYYEITEANRRLTPDGGNINKLWELVFRDDEKLPAFNDTLDYYGEGWELDLTANITENFRGKFNISVPHSEQTNALPDTLAYVAANRAVWEAAASDPTPPNQALLIQELADLDHQVSSTDDEQKLNGDYDYRMNLFVNYGFNDGMLDGLELGFGANFYGEKVIGNAVGDSFDYIQSDRYELYTVTASYSMKVREYPVKINLSISNLLDNDDRVYQNSRNFFGTAYRNSFKWLDPRKATLAVQVDF
ncbi:MAG: TonB-dependent receptor plug domain-containing protein [Candidatus Synoicihabitans palmerolidicus]|nr:TonB-dependent receptor plug domain-containing protein [Candidatus Synoicihabitans palmerolidicus]